MNLELTKLEYRRLLDLVYIGNWILNSTRLDDRFEDYDIVEEKIFAHCPAMGMRSLVALVDGRTYPSRAYEEGGMRLSRTMRTLCFSPFWPRSWQGVT